MIDATAHIHKAWTRLGFNDEGDDGGNAGGAYFGDVWDTGLSVEDAIAKASADKDGERFQAAFSGDLSPWDGDRSAADFYLCRRLGFYLGPNPTLIREAVHRSNLVRPKWDEYRGSDTYLNITIGNALRWVIANGGFYGHRRSSTNGHGPHAEHGGFSKNGKATYTNGKKTPRFTFLTDAEYLSKSPPNYIIPGILPEQSLSGGTGDPGTFKSLFALHMARCITSGRDFFGLPVKQMPVAYLLGEGSLQKRNRAWNLHHGVETIPDFYVLDDAVRFLFDDDLTALYEAVDALPKTPGLFITDTLARSFEGGDENSAEDMGRFVAAQGKVQKRYSAAALAIHHNNRAGSYRGSSAFLGALDVLMTFELTSTGVRVECGKMKDDEPFSAFGLTKTIIDLGNGETSLVLEQETPGAFNGPESDDDPIYLLRPNERTLLGILNDAVDEWTATSRWESLAQARNVGHSSFFAARNALVKGFFVETQAAKPRGSVNRITDAGRAALEPPGATKESAHGG